MPQKKIAAYKYKDKPLPKIYFTSLIGLVLFYSSIPITAGVLLYTKFEPNNFIDFLIPFILILCFLYIIYPFRASQYVIVVSSKYLLFGDQIFYFDNIKSIEVDERLFTCKITSNNGYTKTIDSKNFATNARHYVKIRANQRRKFYTVVEKILRTSQKQVPEGSILVENGSRLTKYQQQEKFQQKDQEHPWHTYRK